MNTPDKKNMRYALAALAIGLTLAGSTLVASAPATEMATEVAADIDTAPADRGTQTPLANLPETEEAAAGVSGAGVSGTTWSFEAPHAASPTLLDLGEAPSTDEATCIAARRESDADALGVGRLATWLPAAANLSNVDAGLVDSFVTAIAAIRASGAAQLVCDTLWELQDLDGPTRSVDTRTQEIDLRERNSVAAAQVAFVLGDVTAPTPDVVFLAFVILQSLWGLACRPRQA